MKQDLISVLIPTYNVEKYVKQAINSILDQTYSNLEIIVVDDCSTDGTYTILVELEKRDKRIRLFRNKKNLKICQTLNKALTQATGTYIARMDGDDLSAPNRIETLYNYLSDHPEIDLVGSQTDTINEEGSIIGYGSHLSSSQYIEFAHRFLSCVSHIWLARRSVYDTLHGYREIPYAEDYDFLLRGELLGFKYANVQERLYQVRLREGNTQSSNGLTQRKTSDYVRFLHRKEKKRHCESFSEEEYHRHIACSNKELTKYQKASNHLQQAIRTKSKSKKIKHVVIAAYSSRHVLKYLFASGINRILIRMERRTLSQ